MASRTGNRSSGDTAWLEPRSAGSAASPPASRSRTPGTARAPHGDTAMSGARLPAVNRRPSGPRSAACHLWVDQVDRHTLQSGDASGQADGAFLGHQQRVEVRARCGDPDRARGPDVDGSGGHQERLLADLPYLVVALPPQPVRDGCDQGDG